MTTLSLSVEPSLLTNSNLDGFHNLAYFSLKFSTVDMAS